MRFRVTRNVDVYKRDNFTFTFFATNKMKIDNDVSK